MQICSSYQGANDSSLNSVHPSNVTSFTSENGIVRAYMLSELSTREAFAVVIKRQQQQQQHMAIPPHNFASFDSIDSSFFIGVSP